MTMDFSAHTIKTFFNNSRPTLIESMEKLILRAALDGKKSATLPLVSGDDWVIPELVRELEEKGFKAEYKKLFGEQTLIIKW